MPTDSSKPPLPLLRGPTGLVIFSDPESEICRIQHSSMRWLVMWEIVWAIDTTLIACENITFSGILWAVDIMLRASNGSWWDCLHYGNWQTLLIGGGAVSFWRLVCYPLTSKHWLVAEPLLPHPAPRECALLMNTARAAPINTFGKQIVTEYLPYFGHCVHLLPLCRSSKD